MSLYDYDAVLAQAQELRQNTGADGELVMGLEEAVRIILENDRDNLDEGGDWGLEETISEIVEYATMPTTPAVQRFMAEVSEIAGRGVAIANSANTHDLYTTLHDDLLGALAGLAEALTSANRSIE